ncbi:DUF4019 domain-containing protein [Teredinibacter turnerae]|uniref:DUF4019 domain-containing protein n=1 Tax=Teredinibacter turnerae TaxID=2426 RepID=UPI000368E47B|nr:DUF4019 domain-containing protein [Teredinibacter turnerae]
MQHYPHRVFVFLTCLGCVLGSYLATAAPESEPVAAALPPEVAAAERWLALADAGDYRETWDQAAPYFKDQLTKSQWEGALGNVRGPLGKLVSRKLRKNAPYDHLPGAPDGEYRVLIYISKFESQPKATEMLILMFTKEQWRLAGYFLR